MSSVSDERIDVLLKKKDLTQEENDELEDWLVSRCPELKPFSDRVRQDRPFIEHFKKTINEMS